VARQVIGEVSIHVALFGALLVIGALLVVLAYALYKLRQAAALMREVKSEVRSISERALQDLFHQFQALLSLQARLGFPQGLPPVRGWAASPDFLLLIVRHVTTSCPNVVVECGSGVSTVALARCMQLSGKGHVYSLEHDARFAAATNIHLKEYDLLDWVTIIEAPLESRDIARGSRPWYSPRTPLPEQIDMLVVDGPPAESGPLARYPAGPLLFGRMAVGASVFMDDMIRADEQEIVRLWLQEFPTLRRVEHACEKGCVELTGF
jgi:predicted O-methyltransferase YrrM